VGWGHSTVEYVVDMALAADVKRLVLFHHDPLRNDTALDGLVEGCRQRVANVNGKLEVLGASEGLVLNVRAPRRAHSGPVDHESSAEDQADLPLHPKVLVADDQPDVLLLLTRTLRAENFDLITASDGEAALLLARIEYPDLILLDWHMPRMDGLAVSRTLRAASDPRLHRVPIVLITGNASAEDMEEGFAAGVTDYLTKPFTPANLRTRARAWLLRGPTSPSV
jgi:two-component system phosphate regulon response regulator PhoB